MSKFSYLLAGLVIVGMAACNEDNKPESPKPEDTNMPGDAKKVLGDKYSSLMSTIVSKCDKKDYSAAEKAPIDERIATCSEDDLNKLVKRATCVSMCQTGAKEAEITKACGTVDAFKAGLSKACADLITKQAKKS